MADQPSEGDRIFANGGRVTLVDGTTKSLAFTFEAMWRLERRFGSLRAFTDALDSQFGGRLIDTVVGALGAAWGEEDTDAVAALLSPSLIGEYTDQILYAFNEALGPPRPGEGKDQAAEPTASPGARSITPPPSGSGVTTTSSAA